MDIVELIFYVITLAMCIPLALFALCMLAANIAMGIVNQQELKEERARREAQKI